MPPTIEPREITLTAPCKVNLTLDVFPPRGDGYHDLDSVVARFAPPGDEIKVSIRPGARRVMFICKDKSLPRGDDNLAVRAARLYLDRFLPGTDVTVYVKLEKRLPVQAGLGGGSSDAATVLRALSDLLPVPEADEATLREVAAGIGSDVPLFLLGAGLVRLRGRGERVEIVPGPAIAPLHGVIVKPTVGVPTGPAYALLDALPDRRPGDATPRLLAALATGSHEEIATAMGNDFEAAILPHYPEIAEAHRAVRDAGALRALLSGSGSAVFGFARDRDHARELTRTLAGRFAVVKMAVGA
jgi:4-diphosphocytidyl-2-C-methyl-D-erythritol kinase